MLEILNFKMLYLCTVGILSYILYANGLEQPPPEELIRIRQNYGIIYTYDSILDTAITFWSHTVVINLDDIQTLPSDKVINFCARTFPNDIKSLVKFLCQDYYYDFKGYDDIKTFQYNKILENQNTIEKLLPTVKRGKRGLFDAGGYVLKQLFGVATKKDIDTLARHIRLIEENPMQTSGFRQMRRDLTSYKVHVKKQFKIYADSLLQVNDLLQKFLPSIDREIHYINQNITRLMSKFTLLQTLSQVLHAINARELSSLNRLVENTHQIVNAIQTMLQGRLPIHFVPIRQMTYLLNQIKDALRKEYPMFRLVHTDVSQYYKLQGLTYTRTKDNIYMQIKIPLTSSNMLFYLYNIQILPVPVQGNNTAFTKLTGIPDYLAVSQDNKYFIQLSKAQLQTCAGDTLKRCDHVLTMLESSRESCALALFFDDTALIMKLCQVNLMPFIFYPLSYVLDLGDGRIMISTNDFEWIQSCPGEPPSKIQGCAACIIRLPCACSLKSSSFYVPPSLISCTMPIDTTRWYSTNLLTLFTFHPKHIANNMSGTTEWQHPLNVTLPKLEIHTSKWANLNAQLDKVMVDLNETVQREHQRLPIIAPVSTYAHSDYAFDDLSASTHNNYWNISPYITSLINFLPYIGIGILTICYCSIRRTLNHINRRIADIASTTMMLLPPPNFEVDAQCITCNNLEVNDKIFLRDYFWAICLFVALSYILVVYMIRYSTKSESTKLGLHINKLNSDVILVLKNQREALNLHIMNIPADVHDIRYKLWPTPLTLSLYMSCFRPYITIDWTFVKINIEPLNMYVHLPTPIRISLFDYFKAKRLLKGPSYFWLLLISDQFKEQICLKNYPSPIKRSPLTSIGRNMLPMPQLIQKCEADSMSDITPL